MKLLRFVGVALIFCVLFSCGKKAADFDSDFELFKNQISAFTSGFVSVKSDIRVQLAFNNTNWKVNQELDADLLDISPSVSGKLIALSSNTLAFVPDEKLEQNTLYQVSLHLDKITEVPKELAVFNFSLKTIKQDFTVTTEDIQSSDKETYYLNGVLKTADFLAFEEAEKLLECHQNGDDLKVVFDKDNSSSTEFKFRVEGIKRFEKASMITLAWDGDASDIDREGESEIAIPAKGDFKVMDIKIGDENNQSLLINFSDPLQKDQDFKGLVTIENTSEVKYATMGNVLKVYFTNQAPIQSEEVVEVIPTEVAVAAVDSAASVVEAAATMVSADTAVAAVDARRNIQ